MERGRRRERMPDEARAHLACPDPVFLLYFNLLLPPTRLFLLLRIYNPAYSSFLLRSRFGASRFGSAASRASPSVLPSRPPPLSRALWRSALGSCGIVVGGSA
eukprot:2015153-Pyramimonas_sp.AAC.1